MTKQSTAGKSRLLQILFGLLLLGAIGVAALVITIDPEAVRHKLEKRFSASFDLQLAIEGEVGLNFFPPGASFADLVIRDGDRTLLTVEEVQTRIALLPLLHQELRLASLTLKTPVWSVGPEGQGLLSRKTENESQDGLLVKNISVQDGIVRYAGEKEEDWVELAGLDLQIEDLQKTSGDLRFSGDFRADRLSIGRIEVADLSGGLSGAGGRFRIDPLKGDLFGSRAEGKLVIDTTQSEPVFDGNLRADQFSMAELCRTLADRVLFEGTADLQVELTCHGTGGILENLDGTVRMSGRDITQHGVNLDRMISKFRDSRDLVDLTDLGVLAFAGPVGFLVSEGVNMADVVIDTDAGGRQVVKAFSFDWRLKDGLAHTRDVALRTEQNRLALKGAIDLVERRYQDMTIALLDTRGCAEMKEGIRGPLTDPTVEQTGLLGSLASSLTGIVEKGLEVIDPEDCQVFYQGEVGPQE